MVRRLFLGNRRFLILLVVFSSIVACRKDEMVGVRQKDFMEDIPAEQYMPNASREVITLESGVTVNKIDSVYVLGGDMILNDRQLELLNCPQSRGAMTGTLSNYWPRGEVYYDIDSKFGDNSAVVKAMTMISALNSYDGRIKMIIFI